MLHRIFLFAHVLSAFLYLLAHGASAAVAYRVRRETSAERVRALLDGAPQLTMQIPSPDELAQVLESGNAHAMTAFAIGGWAMILWLMLFKPF
jgi:hypothetical protein